MSDMNAGGAVDSVKEAFQGKRGKILIVGGGIAIAVYVWYTRRNGTPEPVPADTTTTTDASSGRTPQTDPTVGDTTTGTTTGSGPRKYDNNADWLADGTQFLQGRGTPAAAGYDALSKALAGLALTQQQIAWVSQVISGLGAPPEGMPPLNAAAPPGNPQSTPTPTPKPAPKPAPKPKPKPKPAPKPAATYDAVPVTKSPTAHSTISGIAASYHKSWQSVWNDPKNAGLRAKRKAPNKIQPGDIVYVKK